MVDIHARQALLVHGFVICNGCLPVVRYVSTERSVAIQEKRSGALPEGVRGFFELFLAAKLVGLPFEDFREDMEGREETEAFFAWRKAAHARPR